MERPAFEAIAVRWDRWRRASLGALGWGAFAALVAVLADLTGRNQPGGRAGWLYGTVTAFLVVVGVLVFIAGALGLLAATVAGRRIGARVAAPPGLRRERIWLFAWAVLCALAAVVISLPTAPAGLCALGVGQTVTVNVEGRMADRGASYGTGWYLANGDSHELVIQDAAPPSGTQREVCVGWVGNDHGWTGTPWPGLLVWLLLVTPFAIGALWLAVRLALTFATRSRSAD